MAQCDLTREWASHVRGVLALKVHYLWRRQREKAAPPLPQMIEDAADFWRKTKYYDGENWPGVPGFADPKWTRLRSRLADILAAHRESAASAQAEDEAMALLWPLCEPAIEAHAEPIRSGPGHPFGCWSYTLREADQISIHITNVYRPDSPFQHLRGFAGDLLRLVRHVRARCPERTVLFCGSWLNNLPPFQRLFPPEWAASLHAPCWHNNTYGIWGQYVSRTGGFQAENAAFARRHGRHRYPLVHACCSMASTADYLEREAWQSRIQGMGNTGRGRPPRAETA